MRTARLAAALLAVAAAACDQPQTTAGTDTTPSPAPWFEGLGQVAMTVTTHSEVAQRYFDQGLALTYAFNHAEAERSFRAAARLDPDCAMCWWGTALVLGMNINSAMDPAAAPAAWQALQSARAVMTGVSERERAYIDALSARYTEQPVADRSPLDAAYAEQMKALARAYPDDLHAQALAAEAVLNLHPWQWYTRDGVPAPGTEDAVALLEAALAKDPNHIASAHYYIHATELSPRPERAEPYADRLAALAPGAGHLVHMPSHTYLQVGRYHDCVVANQRAEEADNRYVSQCHAQGAYPLAYIPHNPHFGWACAAMAGESAAAFTLAASTVAHTDHSQLREPGLGTLQHYSVIPLFAWTRFARWPEILAAAAPPEDLRYPLGVWRFVRGLALARTGKADEAAAELDALRAIAVEEGIERVTIWDINSAKQLLDIGVLVLEGELAAGRGEHERAITALVAAARLEDAMRFNEPPDWHFPVRHTLGAVLLDAGMADEAERVYREDLSTFPENGWALLGLAQSLDAQGESAQAKEVRARFERAWAHADVAIERSRL